MTTRGASALVALSTLLVFLAGGASASSPRGLYGRSRLGAVDFAVTDEGAVGTLAAAGACKLPPGVRLIQGVMEGTVFVGEVLLCQEGAACHERTFPLLGVMNGGKLVARVKLDAGCRSPALEEDTLVLEPLSAEERKKLVEALRSGGVRAVDHSARRGIADEAFREAAVALEQGDAGAARRLAGRAVAYDDERWSHHYVLGVAQLHTQEVAAGAVALAHALRLATEEGAAPARLAEMHYHLACAQARLGRREAAYASLRELPRLAAAGQELAKTLEDEPDLRSLAQDPEFKAIARALRGGGPKPEGAAGGR